MNVRIFQNGRVVAQGPTNAQGLVRLSMAVPHRASGNRAEEGEESGQSAEYLVTATAANGEESTLHRSDYAYEEHGDYTVALLTDRPIYRPGQRVFYKGIARRDEGARGTGYAVPQNEPVEVELRDPDGNKVLQERRTANNFGSFWGRAELSDEAPTGTYTLVARIGGEEHTQDILVASYRKPEFSVRVQPLQARYTRGDTIEATISAQYFFGAPVAGARVRYEVTREADWAAEAPDNDWDEWDQNNAPDPGEDYGEGVASGDVTLDGAGRAVVRVPPPDDSESSDGEGANESGWQPQAENWTISAYVTDSTDRVGDGSATARVTQGEYRIFVEPQGYLAQPGQALPVTLEVQDYNGKPVPGAQLRLEAARWTPQSDAGASDTEGDSGELGAAFSVHVVQTDAAGRATTQIVPTQAGETRLTVAGHDSAGHEITAEASVYAVSEADEADDWDWGGGNTLRLVADKRHYRPGDVARVLLAAAKPGEVALLSVEGDRLHRAWTIPMHGHTATVSVPVEASYGPNVFLAACTVRDKTLSSTSIPLRVEVPAREVTVRVVPDAPRLQPGQRAGFTVQARDAAGRPVACEVALGVVDESIYAMREDDPTLLRDTFYPRRENSVTTSSSLDTEYLGDGDKADPVIEARKKFEDTAFWMPNLQTNAAGSAHVEFPLPDNLTTWRATAWAQTRAASFGRATGSVLETKPFLVRLDTPRFWVDGDQSRVEAAVHNDTGDEQQATVKLEAEGLQVDGANQSATIPAHGSATLSWAVTPEMSGLNFAGQARLKLSAWTDNRQLTDAVEQMVPVQPHARVEVTTDAGRVTQSAPQTLNLMLPSDSAPQSARLTVRLAPTLAGSLSGALDYLTGYPYGCTEQTLSRFVPDLAVEGLLRGDGNDAARRAQLARMVRDGVARLGRFQHESGGWGWWEHDEDDPWMTAYALYGLTVARNQGYAINPEMISRAVHAGATMPGQLRRNRNRWRSDQQAVPFLLYALSGASAAGRQAAQRERAKIELNPLLTNEELAYLVLLDARLGAAAQSWAMLESRLTSGDDGRLHWAGSDADEGDRLATSLGLRAMLAVDPNDERAQSVLLWLMNHRTGDGWSSTRDTAFVLLACGDYLRAHPEAAQLTGTLRVKLNGREVKSIALSPALLRAPEVMVAVPWQGLRSGSNSLSIERAGGDSPAFWSYELRTMQAARTLPPVSSRGLNVKREYFRVLPRRTGQDSWTLQTEPSNGDFTSGDQVRVRLTVYTPRPLEHVLIEDHFPSGLEVTERGEADEDTGEDWHSWWSNTDVRDDRIAFFARRITAGTHTIEYNLRAQTPGQGVALPTLVQEMYAPQVRAESGDSVIRVRGD